MATRADANGSGGDRAPGPTPTEIYSPGDVVRYRVGPSGLAAISAQTTFVIEKVSYTHGLHSTEVAYLIAAGNWRKWVTPANLVRIDPPAPSGFVTAPAPDAPAPAPGRVCGKRPCRSEEKSPPAPGPVTAAFAPVALSGANEEFVAAFVGAAKAAAKGPELSPDQNALLVMIHDAGAVGLAFNLGCEAAKKFGRARAGFVIDQLVGLGLARRVRGDDESQGGWCLTAAGEQFAEPLWMAETQDRKAEAARPPESGDVLADPPGAAADGEHIKIEAGSLLTLDKGLTAKPCATVERGAGVDWHALGQGGLESADRRFAVTPTVGQRFDALDRWTGEMAVGVAVLLNAQEWCGKRHREGGAALEWHPNADVDVGAAGPHHERFYCRPAPDGRAWHGVDTRFQAGDALRASPALFTADEAKRWCEVRAACSLEPNGTLRWVSPVPF